MSANSSIVAARKLPPFGSGCLLDDGYYPHHHTNSPRPTFYFRGAVRMALDTTTPPYADAYEHLRLERRGKVLLVTIDRPEQLNATNARLHKELGDVWLDIDRDPDAHVA